MRTLHHTGPRPAAQAVSASTCESAMHDWMATNPSGVDANGAITADGWTQFLASKPSCQPFVSSVAGKFVDPPATSTTPDTSGTSGTTNSINDQGMDVATGMTYADESACRDAYNAFLTAHPEYRGNIATSYTAFATANPPCGAWAQYQGRLLQPTGSGGGSPQAASSVPSWAWWLGGIVVASAAAVTVAVVVTRPKRTRRRSSR